MKIGVATIEGTHHINSTCTRCRDIKTDVATSQPTDEGFNDLSGCHDIKGHLFRGSSAGR